METNFNINRLGWFLKRQGVLNLPSLLISYGAVFGSLLVISLLSAIYNPENLNNMIQLYGTVFVIAGWIFTSNVFAELNKPQRSYAYLTLPVSTFEKFVGSWLLSSPLFILIVACSSFIIYFISCLVAGNMAALAWLMDKDLLYLIGYFMVTQTVFFLGGSVFKSNNFLKTIFSLFILSVVIGLYVLFILYILFEGTHFDESHYFQLNDLFGGSLIKLLQVFFWAIIGPTMLLVSYFKLKERQV